MVTFFKEAVGTKNRLLRAFGLDLSECAPGRMCPTNWPFRNVAQPLLLQFTAMTTPTYYGYYAITATIIIIIIIIIESIHSSIDRYIGNNIMYIRFGFRYALSMRACSMFIGCVQRHQSPDSVFVISSECLYAPGHGK